MLLFGSTESCAKPTRKQFKSLRPNSSLHFKKFSKKTSSNFIHTSFKVGAFPLDGFSRILLINLNGVTYPCSPPLSLTQPGLPSTVLSLLLEQHGDGIPDTYMALYPFLLTPGLRRLMGDISWFRK